MKRSEKPNARQVSNSFPIHEFFEGFMVDDSCSYEKLKALVESNPQGVWKRDELGDLPLHLACRRWYPNEIVSLVKNANTDAVREQDSNGQYPLNIACSSHGNSSLIISMCDMFPEAASIKNEEGNTPLHTLCLTDFEDPPDPECIRVLAEAAPHVILEPDADGDNLILKACDWVLAAAMMALIEDNCFFSWPKDMPELSRSLKNLNTFLRLSPNKAVEALKYVMAEIELRQENECFHLVTYIALQIMIRAHCRLISSTFTEKGIENERLKLMHDVFSPTNELPPLSFKIVRMLFGSHWRDVQRLANEIDQGTNNLPLHKALKSRGNGSKLDPSIIEYLIKLNPKAASMRDDEGDFPLHSCLKQSASMNTVRYVFEAYPQAIYSSTYASKTFNSEEGLKTNNAGIVAAMYDAPLDVIFYLLQENPPLNISLIKKRTNEVEDIIDANIKRLRCS